MIKTELAKVAEQLGLMYDAKDKVMFGEYKGYKIAVKEDLQGHSYYFNFPIKPSESNPKETIDTFIQELLQDKKTVKNAAYEEHSLKVEIAMKGMAKNNKNNIIDLLDRIRNFAKENFYETYCEICGENRDISAYLINGVSLYSCEKCYHQAIEGLNNIQLDIKEQKGNFVGGLVGAVLGSLIGVTLWVIIYTIGYIAAICGVVLAVCTIKGYEKFGGKLNLLGIVTTVLVTIFMVYFSTHLSYGFEVYITFKDTQNIDIFQAIRSVNPLLNEYPEVKAEFIKNLVLGYVFTGIGSISTFTSAYKTSNFKYTTKRLVG